ncbi:MAG: hypothetical protein IJ594_10080 [Oscillospiraceae bacterium]|nr:hypothetical protein [Oscillospiraceae bacterium]
MFGYLVAASGDLTQEQLARYKACYCGLCRSIKARHGQLARLSLTYDMTFLALLLNSLYEPEETCAEETCIAHPVKARPWWNSEVTDYAADMNVAMAYLKCLDDWEDDGNPAALAEAGLFKRAYAAVEERYPRQCAVIRGSLDALHALEKARCEDADAAADSFGRLMAEVLVYREDRWSDALRGLGMALGRFLYVMDACMDLNSDTIRGRYNPFRRFYGLPDNEQRFRDVLKMLLGEGLVYFDRLPLVQDVGLLQNILCAGLWAQFDEKYGDKKGQADGTGSV